MVVDLVNKNQILLTNYFTLQKHKEPYYGASAFLVQYKGRIMAVTAKHLLGSDMGVKPKVKPHKLDKKLVKWLLYPRKPIQAATDTIEVDAKNIDYTHLKLDILLLNVVKNNSNVLPLLPATKPLVKGEKAYLIGCPYFQEDCKQNVYEITYNGSWSSGMLLFFDLSQELPISGFSGAPIVNGQGKVIGVLRGGSETMLVATSIEALGTISISE